MNFPRLQEREQLRSQGGRCIDCAYPIKGNGQRKIKHEKSGKAIKLHTVIVCSDCCHSDIAMVSDDAFQFSDAKKAQGCFLN
ncbi:MAG: hypothetical protein V1867_05565 [Candidatus Falkowbacteria bacterium]